MSLVKNEAELLAKLDAIGPTDDEERNSITCAIIGHSKIQHHFFGEFTCARCGDRVGDSLAGIYSDAPNVVVVGHDCDVCHSSYANLDWRDKIFTPDPFKKDI
jgi:hypothetical protein